MFLIEVSITVEIRWRMLGQEQLMPVLTTLLILF